MKLLEVKGARASVPHIWRRHCAGVSAYGPFLAETAIKYLEQPRTLLALTAIYESAKITTDLHIKFLYYVINFF